MALLHFSLKLRLKTGGSGVDSPQLTKFLFGKGPVIFIGRQFAGCGKGGEGGDHVLALSFLSMDCPLYYSFPNSLDESNRITFPSSVIRMAVK